MPTAVSWQDEAPNGGVIVSNEILLALDVEAVLLDDVEEEGAIDYCLEQPCYREWLATRVARLRWS
jgi:hypothetical protein